MFPFLSLVLPLLHPSVILGFGEENKERKNIVFLDGGPELQGICWVTKKRLVAREEKLGYLSYWKNESFVFF
jgi:hypothetical protein